LTDDAAHATLQEGRMYPFLLALLLLLHALAHAGVGIWAAGASASWLVTALWLVAMGGFMGASFAIFGLDRLRPHAERLTIAAALGSAMLLRLTGVALWSLAGLALGVALALLVRRWARCAHPEIHTPTLRTAGAPVVDDAPTTPERLVAGLAYAALTITVVLIVARPWYQSWGSSRQERSSASTFMPLEDVAGAARYRIDRAVTVRAPAQLVWPWIAQLGQDRAGFYSHEWLERAAGLHVTNADSLVPAWQRRQVGEVLRAAQPGYLGGRLGEPLGWRITRWDPPRSMSLEGWGTFVVSPIDDSTTRVRVHTRAPGVPTLRALPTAWLRFYVVEPAHFVMERAMLLGVKRRAERLAASGVRDDRGAPELPARRDPSRVPQ
jgi:hypothetical protein